METRPLDRTGADVSVVGLGEGQPDADRWDVDGDTAVDALARVPLASRYDESTTFAADGHRSFDRHGEAFDEAKALSGVPVELGVAAAREVAGDVPTPAFALRRGIDRPGATAVIPGARTPLQVRGNVAVAALPPLTESQLAELERVHDERIRAHVHDRW